MNREVKRKRSNKKLNIQKIFNIGSLALILACCIFYGGRFLKLYLENNKSEEVKAYFAEYLQSSNIDFVTFEQSGINVTLSASLKSLKEAAKKFIDKVSEDLNLIGTFNNSAEILVEYKKTLNVSASITSVTSRMQAIEAEKKRQEAEQERKEAEAKRAEEVKQAAENNAPEVLEAPKVEKTDDQVLTLRFQVTASRSKLKELKAFLDNGGYEYV